MVGSSKMFQTLYRFNFDKIYPYLRLWQHIGKRQGLYTAVGPLLMLTGSCNHNSYQTERHAWLSIYLTLTSVVQWVLNDGYLQGVKFGFDSRVFGIGGVAQFDQLTDCVEQTQIQFVVEPTILSETRKTMVIARNY